MGDAPPASSMPKILVGYPFLKPHTKGLPHLIQFYGICSKTHEMVLEMPMYRPLHKAQQTIVDAARHWKCSHILFIEDDQWGFPVDGLDILLGHDKDVVGLPTYKKKYPYLPMACRRKRDGESLLEANELDPIIGEGLEKVDLITFGFTLVRTSVFDRIENPFALPYADHPADSYFSQYCDDAGIEKWVDYRFIVGHGDLSPQEIPYRRMAREMMDSGVPPSPAVPPMPENLRKRLQDESSRSEL